MFFKSTSTLLIITALVVTGSGLSAQAEAPSSNTIQEITTSTEQDAANTVTTEQISNQEIKTSASALKPESFQTKTTNSVIAQTDVTPEPGTTPSSTPDTTPGLEPGRATRSGPSYLGVGGNIGLTGDDTVGEGGLSVITKIGLTRNLSVRPGVVISGDPVVYLPVTFDFPIDRAEGSGFSFAPYIGGGAVISTGDDSNVGGLVTAGVDIPLANRLVGNASVDAGFGDTPDVGIRIGVGYSFAGF